MTDSKFHTPETGTLQGRIFQPTTREEIAEAVELAFDYRGDVLLVLRSGAQVEGYIFTRNSTGDRPSLEMFPKEGEGVCVIPFADIVSIAFSGEDTASGKSWEAWVAKKESERRAEAERVAQDAQARGHL